MEIAYIVAECRPSTDEDNYADINIGDDSYIFAQLSLLWIRVIGRKHSGCNSNWYRY